MTQVIATTTMYLVNGDTIMWGAFGLITILGLSIYGFFSIINK